MKKEKIPRFTVRERLRKVIKENYALHHRCEHLQKSVDIINHEINEYGGAVILGGPRDGERVRETSRHLYSFVKINKSLRNPWDDINPTDIVMKKFLYTKHRVSWYNLHIDVFIPDDAMLKE